MKGTGTGTDTDMGNELCCIGCHTDGSHKMQIGDPMLYFVRDTVDLNELGSCEV